VYGDDRLVRGAGLYVGDTGVVTSHHFLLSEGEKFDFRDGDYDVRVFGRIVGDRYPKLLIKQKLNLSIAAASALTIKNTGIYFDYGPISGAYIAKPHGSITSFSEAFRERSKASRDVSLPRDVD